MKRIYILIAVLAVGALAAQAVIVPAQVRDTARQDVLTDQSSWHELGIGFPADEAITATSELYVGEAPCPLDYLGGTMYKVTIQNLSSIAWRELHYVADPETAFTNDDGEAQDLTAPGWTLAFKIDDTGLNQPLLSESISADNIFQPGEIWEFVVQDYSNGNGLLPHELDSWDGINQGQISFASAGGPPSSASIIAIPEPSVVALFGVFGLGLFIRRRLMI